MATDPEVVVKSAGLSARRKVIMVVSEDWYFLSHRIELARYLVKEGWEVLIATQVNRPEYAARITEAGLRLMDMPLERGRLLASGDLLYWWRLFRLYRAERPDVVHHVAMKPVLYGSLAALGSRKTGVVNALAGLGYLFTSVRGAVKVVRRVVLKLFRWLFARRRTRVILQNAEDMMLFREELGLTTNLRLVRGAGVDVARYQPVVHAPRDPVVAVMVARLLRDKGVEELVAAARILRSEGVPLRVQLAGDIDPKNPNSLTQAEVEALRAEGVVELLGHRSDIDVVYGAADIAVLPSYREGLPKSLLEAAASGLPIIATDTSGCREVVAEGRNGLLVPPREVLPLAEALRRLASDPALRANLGAAGRRRAENEFRQELIFAATLEVYQEVLRD